MKDKPFDYSKATIISNDFAEPISNGLEAAADEYANSIAQFEAQRIYSKDDFIAGANWREEQFEKNRLSACDSQTEEEAQREMDFAMNIIKKEHRQPTYSDAIEYGMRVQKEQMMKYAVDAAVNTYECVGESSYVEFVANLPVSQFRKDDKVKLIIVKEADDGKCNET